MNVQLRDFYQNYLQVTDEALLEEAVAVTEVRTVRRGDRLIQAGKMPTHMCFLVSGIVRGVMLDGNGKDITDCIVYRCGAPVMPDNDFTRPASITLEALTDCEIVCLPLAAVGELMERYPALAELKFHLVLFSAEIHRKLKIATYQYTAAQRYEWFLQEYPGLIDQISHKYIASLLNMTPVTLSKIRNSRRKAQADRPGPEPVPDPAK